jgi:hypothetical protein
MWCSGKGNDPSIAAIRAVALRLRLTLRKVWVGNPDARCFTPVDSEGIEPSTSIMSGLRSTNELRISGEVVRYLLNGRAPHVLDVQSTLARTWDCLLWLPAFGASWPLGASCGERGGESNHTSPTFHSRRQRHSVHPNIEEKEHYHLRAASRPSFGISRVRRLSSPGREPAPTTLVWFSSILTEHINQDACNNERCPDLVPSSSVPVAVGLYAYSEYRRVLTDGA